LENEARNMSAAPRLVKRLTHASRRPLCLGG
jgi:hypothetical protein